MLLYNTGPGFRILPGHERTTPKHERTILLPMSDPNKPQTELAGAPAKDEAPRESLIDRIRPFILIFLLLFLPTALFHAFTDYMYVYRVPAGTKVVGTSTIPQRSRLGEYIYGSVLIKKWHWDWLVPYLDYRHCIIPEGAEEIASRAFVESFIRDDLRSVRIPGSVKKIGDWAFQECDKLTDIVIPGSVEQLGDGVFLGCRSLRRVVIPGSVKRIGNYMFQDCTGLSEVMIPDGVKAIGYAAFSGCSVLRAIDIPDSVECIGDGAFHCCSSLEEIRLPAGMGRKLTEEEKQRRLSAGSIIPSPTIGQETFSRCIGLQKVTLPDGIERIDVDAFRGCHLLCAINLPDSLTGIGDLAFYGCRSLTPLTIGRQVTDIGGGAFTGTRCDLTVPNDHPAFRFENGILYLKDEDGSKLISCISPPDGPCEIAQDVKMIGPHAFEGCDSITEIRLPNRLEEIGEAAFSWCTGLKHLELPDSLWLIEPAAFMDCAGLAGTLAIPSNVTVIGGCAFSGCHGLTELTIPPSVKMIPSDAFSRCSNLKHVTLPDSVKNIGDGAFSDCESLNRETVERLNAVNPKAFSRSLEFFEEELYD